MTLDYEQCEAFRAKLRKADTNYIKYGLLPFAKSMGSDQCVEMIRAEIVNRATLEARAK